MGYERVLLCKRRRAAEMAISQNIMQKLNYLFGTKQAIREALIARGVPVPESTPFRDYAAKVYYAGIMWKDKNGNTNITW